MEKKCPRCDSEDDFFKSSLLEGVCCNECEIIIEEELALAYVQGTNYSRDSFTSDDEKEDHDFIELEI